MENKIGAFYNMLSKMEGKEYIETLISFNVALISAKLKPSITLNLSKIDKKNSFNLWNEYGKAYLKIINLSYISLRENAHSLIILIYDDKLLNKFINKSENRRFLTSIGYVQDKSVNKALDILKTRYTLFKCPHELGIFLGYPLDDVQDFINCSHKKCLTCGYWKVYNSVEKAERIFTIFDQAKDFAADNIIKGKKAKELSLTLRYTFKGNNFILFET